MTLKSGRITLVEADAALEHMEFLKTVHGLQVTYYSCDEIRGVGAGFEIIWRRDHGAQLVVDLPCQDILGRQGIIAECKQSWYSQHFPSSFLSKDRRAILPRPTEMKESYTIQLSPWDEMLPPAFVVVEPAQRQKPANGDGFEVSVWIHLPCANDGSQDLHDKMQFGQRCEVMAKALDAQWGRVVIQGRRGRCINILAQTPERAARLAVAYAYAELDKLVALLAMRQ